MNWIIFLNVALFVVPLVVGIRLLTIFSFEHRWARVLANTVGIVLLVFAATWVIAWMGIAGAAHNPHA